MNLSLSPRFDLFKFSFPKDFLSDEVTNKYQKILSRNAGVITSPIDYLNESIRGIHIPGINDITLEQPQHEFNPIVRLSPGDNHLGRINIEPSHSVVYKAASNPLEKMEREFTVTLRMNQGLYNYFMLYETVFEQTCKHINKDIDSVLYVEILNENGEICGRILFKDCYINGIDGLDFEYDKTTRDAGTFNITFKFNNLNFNFLP